MKILLLTIIFQALTLTSNAIDIIPINDVSGLGVRIEKINYPDKLQNELISGLTTKVLFRLHLKSGSETIKIYISEYAVKYDLWDEDFIFKQNPAVKNKTLFRVKSKQDALRRLSRPVFSGIYGRAIPSNKPFKIRVDVLLNPIQKEKMAHIRKWVAQNSVSNPLNPTGGRSIKSAGARGDTVFNTIFEQFTKGESIAGVWTTSGESREFKMEGVKNEK